MMIGIVVGLPSVLMRHEFFFLLFSDGIFCVREKKKGGWGFDCCCRNCLVGTYPIAVLVGKIFGGVWVLVFLL
jgi:hypothetical protein